MLPSAVVRGQKNPACYGLAERLREARQRANLDGKALSLRAGLSHDTSFRIEQQGRFPGVDTVEKLANALGVSPCWLAYSEARPFRRIEGLRCAGLPARLREARERMGLSCRALGAASDVSGTTVSRAEKGLIFPGVDTVEKLAKALRITPCWLAYSEGSLSKVAHQTLQGDTHGSGSV